MYESLHAFPLSYYSPKLEGRSHPTKGGKGVFAIEKIFTGELICIWGGQILTGKQVLQLPLDQRQMLVQIDDDLYQYSFQAGVAEWINHSCEPNTGISGQIALVAMRNIEPGEEICFDYAMAENNTFKHTEFDCCCGEINCRQKITGLDWQNPILWEKYSGFFSLHIQRQIDKLKQQLAIDTEYYVSSSTLESQLETVDISQTKPWKISIV